MNEFLKSVNAIFQLSDIAEEDLMNRIRSASYVKGDIIHEQGKLCKHLFFVHTGLVKHFNYHNGNQYVLRFFEENSFFIATDSFFNNLPAEYSTQAIENSSIVYLEYQHFEDLCRQHHTFESFARRFVSFVAYTAISNLKKLLYLNATERYQSFLEEFGYLQQRISLGDTAAYLGISQVSLSRIRSKK